MRGGCECTEKRERVKKILRKYALKNGKRLTSGEKDEPNKKKNITRKTENQKKKYIYMNYKII